MMKNKNLKAKREEYAKLQQDIKKVKTLFNEGTLTTKMIIILSGLVVLPIAFIYGSFKSHFFVSALCLFLIIYVFFI